MGIQQLQMRARSHHANPGDWRVAVKGGARDIITAVGGGREHQLVIVAARQHAGVQPVGRKIHVPVTGEQTFTCLGLQHCTKDGGAKILKQCTLPLTGKGKVNKIVTELAVFRVEAGLVLEELQPGVTVEQVRACTEAGSGLSVR